MRNREMHMGFWIEELKGYGVSKGPNGVALENLDYYDLRSMVVREQMQRDLEMKASPWF